MIIQLTGIIGALFTFCTLLIMFVIIGFGTFYLLSFVLLEWIIRPTLNYLKSWKILIEFVWHRKEFIEWQKRIIPDEDTEE